MAKSTNKQIGHYTHVAIDAVLNSWADLKNSHKYSSQPNIFNIYSTHICNIFLLLHWLTHLKSFLWQLKILNLSSSLFRYLHWIVVDKRYKYINHVKCPTLNALKHACLKRNIYLWLLAQCMSLEGTTSLYNWHMWNLKHIYLYRFYFGFLQNTIDENLRRFFFFSFQFK